MPHCNAPSTTLFGRGPYGGIILQLWWSGVVAMLLILSAFLASRRWDGFWALLCGIVQLSVAVNASPLLSCS